MIQRRAARFVLNKPWTRNGNESVTDMLIDLKWPFPQVRHRYLRHILLINIVDHLLLIPDQYLPSPAKLTSIRSS